MTERPASDGREGYGAHPDEVDVRDDGKISDVLFVHSCCSCLLSARRRRAPNGASKRFALGQNLAAGRIHFARGFFVLKGSRKSIAFLGW